jgi:hypothetical protein
VVEVVVEGVLMMVERIYQGVSRVRRERVIFRN